MAREYTVRESSRVKKPRLRINWDCQIEVIVPPRFPKARIKRMVEESEPWIVKTLQRLEKQREKVPNEPAGPVSAVHLRSTNRTLALRREQGLETDATLRELPGDVLLFKGELAPDEEADLLRRWLRDEARDVLSGHIARVCQATGYACPKLSVRSQRSRWGSCSKSGTISLNDRLVFLPEHLVEYVLVHELCHTREMNHSAAFWRLVQQHVPDWRQRRREMREAWQFVPHWAL